MCEHVSECVCVFVCVCVRDWMGSDTFGVPNVHRIVR